MKDILIWIFAIVFVEATVEIEVESELFIAIRSRISQFSVFGRLKWLGWYFNGLLSCGYCLSVWISAVIALFIPTTILDANTVGSVIGRIDATWPFVVVDYIIKIFVLHRLSNVWHELVYRWLERMPYMLAFKKPDIIDIPPFIGDTNPNEPVNK
jgi:hypothetical protein